MSTPQRPITSPPRAVSPSATGRGVVHLDPSCSYPESACICAICTCGKHKCPDRAIHVPFAGDSTYHHDYPAHPINPRQLPPKAVREEDGVPFDGITEYHQRYPAHPISPRQLPPKAVREDDGIPFEGTTTYVRLRGGSYCYIKGYLGAVHPLLKGSAPTLSHNFPVFITS